MRKNNHSQSTTLTVSDNTANFIGCLNTMQALYEQVRSSLDQMVGDSVGDTLIEDRFYKEFTVLEDRIQEFLMMSIKENIGTIGSDKI